MLNHVEANKGEPVTEVLEPRTNARPELAGIDNPLKHSRVPGEAKTREDTGITEIIIGKRGHEMNTTIGGIKPTCLRHPRKNPS